MGRNKSLNKPLSKWSIEDLGKALRAEGEKSLFFFAKEVCEFGYNPDPNGPRITEDQRPLCDFLQALYENDERRLRQFFIEYAETQYKGWDDEKLNKEFTQRDGWLAIILAPRDTLKSTVIQAFALWLIVKNPDVRILFYGEVHEQAQKRMKVIQRIIQSGKRFQLCYGDISGEAKKLPWNEDVMVVGTRKNLSIREGTIETAGLDVVVNSRHYDWIFPDDLHSDKNTKSKEQIEGVKEKVQLLTPLVSKGGKVVFTGVFWNDSDYHTRILEELKPHVFLRDVFADGDAESISNYPNALPIEELKKKRRTMTEYQFSCHYRMKPVSMQNQMFPKERFGIVPRGTFMALRNYLIIDPAGDPTSQSKEKRDSDYYGMTVWSINGQQEMLLTDGFMERLDPTEAVEFAMALILRYKPFVIGVEKAAMGNMAHFLREEIRKQGAFAFVDDLTPFGRSKLQRVSVMEPYVRRRKIFIAEECPIKDEFLYQIGKVTPQKITAKNDELIDCFGYLADMLKKYGLPAEGQYDNEIPAELISLDHVSREYWMAVRRADNRLKHRAWANEFVN